MNLVPLDGLPETDHRLLQELGSAADALGVELWLVGGSVRDALLNHPLVDLDLTSEMSADELVPSLMKAVEIRVISRSRFGTIKLAVGNRTLDIATARSEHYPRPGSLPAISPSNMATDLARRDFSINAMAASLKPESFGALLDPENGVTDLDARVIRSLYDDSFRDDPTRMLRAVRYANRLKFDIEPLTHNRLKGDLQYLERVSSSRIRRELERMLTEPEPGHAVLTALKLGVLSAIEAGLGTDEVQDAVLQAAGRQLSGLALLGALVYALPPGRAQALQARIAATQRQKRAIDAVTELRLLEPALKRASLGSEVALVVGAPPHEAVQAVAASTPNEMVRHNLDRYLDSERQDAFLNGNDLIALGLTPGPQLGAMVQSLRHAAMDRLVRSRDEALAYVNKRLEEEKV